MRTIEGFNEYLAPVDEVLNNHFIPTLFGMDTQLPELREVIGLKSSDGGLNIPVLESTSKVQFESSVRITSPHVAFIINQEKMILEKNKLSSSNPQLFNTNQF